MHFGVLSKKLEHRHRRTKWIPQQFQHCITVHLLSHRPSKKHLLTKYIKIPPYKMQKKTSTKRDLYINLNLWHTVFPQQTNKILHWEWFCIPLANIFGCHNRGRMKGYCIWWAKAEMLQCTGHTIMKN